MLVFGVWCKKKFLICHKLGCFKRRKLPDDDEEADSLRDDVLSGPLPALSEEAVGQSKADSKSEPEPSEENKLLDNNEANGSTSPLPLSTWADV